jgi:hypothetical protein
MPEAAIAGYSYGSAGASPVTMEELSLLRASVLFGGEDEAALREAGTILGGQVEQVLDVWYGFVGDNPQLLAHFSTLDGEPIGDYLDGVRGRFGQWIRDTCERPYDDAWLAYQHEMALRHTPDRKNLTDGVSSTSHVPLRYLIALIYPITATIRPFLAANNVPPERVEAMHDAWRKSVIMQIALWSRAYAPDLW